MGYIFPRFWVPAELGLGMSGPQVAIVPAAKKLKEVGEF